MKRFSLFAGAALALTLVASPAQAATDLPESYGFYEEVTYLMNEDIVSGYPDGTVRPDSTVTRAEAAIMIGRMQDLDGTQRDSRFSDVTKGQKASGFIAKAQEAGYINGYPDGTFRPYEPITRGDMAIILSRVFVTPFGSQISFTDVSYNMAAAPHIGAILGANITVGYTDNTFKPYNKVTRGQFSAFLARGLEPEFKNDARIAHSYMKDKTKTYSYRLKDGSTEVHSFDYVPEGEHGSPIGFIWSADLSGTADDYLYGEFETHHYYTEALPYTDVFFSELEYPIEQGKVFGESDINNTKLTITGVNKTVETPYKKFTNAVEVTITNDYENNGAKYYMVEGYSTVKNVDENGVTTFELVDVE